MMNDKIIKLAAYLKKSGLIEQGSEVFSLIKESAQKDKEDLEKINFKAIRREVANELFQEEGESPRDYNLRINQEVQDILNSERVSNYSTVFNKNTIDIISKIPEDFFNQISTQNRYNLIKWMGDEIQRGNLYNINNQEISQIINWFLLNDPQFTQLQSNISLSDTIPNLQGLAPQGKSVEESGGYKDKISFKADFVKRNKLSSTVAKRIFSYELSDDYKKLLSDEEVIFVEIGAALNELEHSVSEIFDFLKSEGVGLEKPGDLKELFTIDLNSPVSIKNSFNEINDKQTQWHTEMAEAQSDISAEGIYPSGYMTNEVVLDFGDGWNAVYLPSADEGPNWEGDSKLSHDRINEGNIQGLCLGSGSQMYQTNSEGKIYSIRNPQNRPRATIRIKDNYLEEIKGKHNNPPDLITTEHVIEFIEKKFPDVAKYQWGDWGKLPYVDYKDVVRNFPWPEFNRHFSELHPDSLRIKQMVKEYILEPEDIKETQLSSPMLSSILYWIKDKRSNEIAEIPEGTNSRYGPWVESKITIKELFNYYLSTVEDLIPEAIFEDKVALKISPEKFEPLFNNSIKEISKKNKAVDYQDVESIKDTVFGSDESILKRCRNNPDFKNALKNIYKNFDIDDLQKTYIRPTGLKEFEINAYDVYDESLNEIFEALQSESAIPRPSKILSPIGHSSHIANLVGILREMGGHYSWQIRWAETLFPLFKEFFSKTNRGKTVIYNTIQESIANDNTNLTLVNVSMEQINLFANIFLDFQKRDDRFTDKTLMIMNLVSDSAYNSIKHLEVESIFATIIKELIGKPIPSVGTRQWAKESDYKLGEHTFSPSDITVYYDDDTVEDVFRKIINRFFADKFYIDFQALRVGEEAENDGVITFNNSYEDQILFFAIKNKILNESEIDYIKNRGLDFSTKKPNVEYFKKSFELYNTVGLDTNTYDWKSFYLKTFWSEFEEILKANKDFKKIGISGKYDLIKHLQEEPRVVSLKSLFDSRIINPSEPDSNVILSDDKFKKMAKNITSEYPISFYGRISSTKEDFVKASLLVSLELVSISDFNSMLDTVSKRMKDEFKVGGWREGSIQDNFEDNRKIVEIFKSGIHVFFPELKNIFIAKYKRTKQRIKEFQEEHEKFMSEANLKIHALSEGILKLGLEIESQKIKRLLQKTGGDLINLFPDETDKDEDEEESIWLAVLGDGETYDILENSAAVEVYPEELEEIDSGKKVIDIIPVGRWYDLGYNSWD